MADGKIRINKVLKDFNIGTGTLQEFFKKKNIDIEVTPIGKISEEVYDLVAKEFSKEQILKEQASKVAIKVKEITEMSHHGEAQEPVKEIVIKTNVLGTAAPAKAEEPVKAEPKPVKEEPLTIEPEPKPVESAPAPKPEPAPAPVPEPAPAPVAEEPEKPQVKEQPAETPAAKTEAAPAPAPKPIKEPKKPAEPAPGSVKPEKPAEVKKEAAPAAKPEPQAEAKPERREPEHIATSVEKLDGPKITGKIDLSQFEKKPSKDSKDKKDKGKRERIKKGGSAKVDVEKAGINFGENNKPQRNDSGKGGKGGKASKKERFKALRTEINEDEVQKQIKETYARMVEGKGKTKTSKHRREKREEVFQKMQEEQELQELTNKVLKVTEFVTVNELAILMNNTPVVKVIEACMNLGLMVSINQRLDAEALVLVAEEFGYEIEFVKPEAQAAIEEKEDAEEDLVPRPPIVTVMGHVDHGKTSLLDYIRNTNVIAGEAGGITQHIGAYSVVLEDGRHITFLDTPGHEAFTAMRARGAKVTDLAIIIVAADDAVMPQTVEAINHAQAAGVPMIFAINKIDKPGANPEKIKEQLANMNILVEDWGGKYQCQEISAKKGLNVDLLLEKVLLEADMLDLKANPDKLAVGSIIESSLDKGRGYLATVLIQGGTLHVGDPIVAGCYAGRVKAMFNERGQRLKEAGPSTPVSVLGLSGAPTAGDTLNATENEKEARDVANKREQLIRIQGIKTQTHITLEEIGRRIALGNFQELNIIVKADVDGSIEALSDSLIKLSTEEFHVNVIHKAVGAISESDVMLAVASNAIIIGFQVRPMPAARKLAEKESIEIRLYSVIYDAIEEVKDGIEGMLAPEQKEEVTATAEVRETFKISKVGTIAGCMVKEGKLTRTSRVRVIRDGIVIYTGNLGSLKRFKDDVKEVAAGFDCGLNIESFNDVQIGDVIEAFQIVEIKRKL
ncbi:MAG: translation initiation factor IF-2 [Bacteroidales bacterium]|nr:translation initiation factor IF-2 [Bacteroidales bacterium]